jgi:hypothetical protein
VNPQHRHRLEKARDRKLTGIDHFESDFCHIDYYAPIRLILSKDETVSR